MFASISHNVSLFIKFIYGEHVVHCPFAMIVYLCASNVDMQCSRLPVLSGGWLLDLQLNVKHNSDKTVYS